MGHKNSTFNFDFQTMRSTNILLWHVEGNQNKTYYMTPFQRMLKMTPYSIIKRIMMIAKSRLVK